MSEQGAIKAKVALVDMGAEQISANIVEFLKAVYPTVRKFNAQPFKKITLSPTMGAPVKLNVASVMEQIA